jgi:hypothetical protein
MASARSVEGGHEYSAAIRVTSRTLRLAEITARLGPPLLGGHDRDDPRVPGRPDRGAWAWTLWYHESDRARDVNLDEHVAQLAVWAEQRREALGALRDAGAEVYLWCAIWTPERSTGRISSLPPELLRRVVELELPLVLDVY